VEVWRSVHYDVLMSEQIVEQSRDYLVVERAIRFLERNFREQPDLEEIAASVHLSKYHFQRLFKRWAGVTPSQFLRYLTIEYAKDRLRESQSVFDASLEAGLSGPSRLHDLFVTFEAMTPGEFKQRGAGTEIGYGFHSTPFGEALLGITERGICALRFVLPEGRESSLNQFRKEWPEATFVHRPGETAAQIRRIFRDPDADGEQGLHLFLRGTNFQVQVWRALLAIPPGALVSYQDVAAYISKPSAVRASANAVAKNPISYIIPCHRVITKAGKAHRYRWGSARKKAMLGWEASRFRAESA
jgi:AraC family transcriptional regulator of adaptative response/methylated-DNA-[protein]-cysteine methyltransferase